MKRGEERWIGLREETQGWHLAGSESVDRPRASCQPSRASCQPSRARLDGALGVLPDVPWMQPRARPKAPQGQSSGPRPKAPQGQSSGPRVVGPWLLRAGRGGYHEMRHS